MSRPARRHGAVALTFIATLLLIDQLRAAPAEDASLARAKSAVTELKTTLRKELEQAMAAGGPDNAIGVCQKRAPALAKEIGEKHDVLVGRSSHKVRNPANKPRPWAKPVIDEWLKSALADWKPRTVSVSNGVVGYVEPIVTQAPCLMCHGEHVPDAMRAKIQAAYPSDQAIGFKEGDLRGVFWVEAKSSTPTKTMETK